MKRVYVLGVIIMAGVLAVAVAELGARQDAPPAGQGREGGQGRGVGRAGFVFPPIGKIEKVADNLYWLPGAGGNTAIYVTGNGVVLVDTKLTGNGQAILDQVKTVTDKPITHIINTHTHADHTGSNQFFPASVEIVTHQNTKANMEKMEVFQQAANKHGLPDRTFKDKMTLLRGNDAIDLYYFGAAHTNGDAFVVFRNLRVMHAGDAFANKGQPVIDRMNGPGIDRMNGGSAVAFSETLTKAAKGIRNVETVITGHAMTLMKWQDFVEFGELHALFLTHARESLKMGKTPEQAMMDFKLPEKFKGYSVAGRGGAVGPFGTIYEELKGQ